MSKETKTTEGSTDPNKGLLLEPGEGDAAAEINSLSSELLPVSTADDSSVGEADPTATEAEPAATDTETETDDTSDTETETAKEGDDPDIALLREYDLDRTYSDIPAALAGAREKERLVEQQRQQMQTMSNTLDRLASSRQPQEQQPATEFSRERFEELLQVDPQAALAYAGVLTRNDVMPLVKQVDTQQQQLSYAQQQAETNAFYRALEEHEELADVAAFFRSNGTQPPRGANKLYDEMGRIYQATPGLANGPLAASVPLLYAAAKQRLSTTKVAKVPESVKQGASTTSRGRGKQRSSGLPDWDRMTIEEHEKWLRDHGA